MTDTNNAKQEKKRDSRRDRVEFAKMKLCGAALLFDAGEITEDDLILTAVQYAYACVALRFQPGTMP